VPLDRRVAPSSAQAADYRPPLPEIKTLSNGVKLWVFPHGELPTVAGSLILAGGAILQRPSEPGLGQLTLSMLEEGTGTRTAAEIALAAESMGAVISASCGWDGASISFRCLKDDLAATLDLVVDILANPTFPEQEWQRVQGQSLASLQAERDRAESRAYRSMLESLYDAEHPYRFPLAGTVASVTTFSTSDLKEFHNRFVVPNLLAVVVAGAVDPAALAGELERRLGSWPRSNLALPVVPDAPHAAAPRLLLLDRPGAPQAVVRVGHRGIARMDPAYELIMLFNQVLGGQFTSRLNEKLREERGFTYGVRSSLDCRRGAGPFSIGTAVQSDRVSEALNDIKQELRAILADRPPTQFELDDARRALVEGHPRHFETPSALVNRFGNLLIHDLPPDHEAGFAGRLAGIDRDSLIAAVQAQVHPDALVAVVVADAASVTEDLRQLAWADLELIQD
jgi:zinc protease